MSPADLSGFSMMDLFRTEVENQAGALNDGLLALEGADDPAAASEPLMRAAHSIKGAARIIGLDVGVRVAHAMEDAFVAAQKGEVRLSGEHVDALLSGVDLLVELSKAPEDGLGAWAEAHASEVDDLCSTFARIQRGEVLAPSKPAEPAGTPAAGTVSADLSGFSMMDLFRTEVENQALVLNDGLLALEGADDPAAASEPLMRAAHSIKGAARIIGLDVGVRVAHAMEDAFVAAQKGEVHLSGEHVDALLSGVDLLVELSQAPEDGLGAWAETHASRVEVLCSVCGRIQRGEPLSPADRASAGATVGRTAPVSGSEPASTEVPDAPAVASDATSGQAAVSRSSGPGVTAAESAPADAPQPARADRAPEPEVEKRFVRVAASSMNSLLDLSGETLVQVGWFGSFGSALSRAQYEQDRLAMRLGTAVQALDDGNLERLRSLLEDCAAINAGILANLAADAREFDEVQVRVRGLAESLYREVLKSRMRPFRDGVAGFPRMVRDLARQLGRRVDFRIDGMDTQVDRDILEKLEAPLTHLIRNAVDHGLETPEDRVASGKPETGRICLRAEHVAGMLRITVEDDGRGVDPDRLAKRVVEKGLAGRDMVERMSRAELLEFLFLPSFSTRDQVSDVSGRGVGLDVVRTMLQEVRGNVVLRSEPGRGAVFQLDLPLTLSVIRSLLVEVGGEVYAMPLYRVDRCLLVVPEDLRMIEDRQYVRVQEDTVGLVGVRQILGYAEDEERCEQLPVVVVADHGERYGLMVDRFVGERDLVVRLLDPALGKVPDVQAAAVLDDGTPLLILDVEDLLHSAEQILSTGRLRHVHRRGDAAVPARAAPRILVVDDSITVREVERRLLESRGYDVAVAVDGVDGWNAVRSAHFDLLISDVDMPRMTGIELVRHVRSDPQLKGLPVMIVSYKDREEDRVAGLEAGADYYLTKSSFQDETLIQAVADLIGETEP
jgi:two-component system sensor histidine kinase and response regulator WspE